MLYFCQKCELWRKSLKPENVCLFCICLQARDVLNSKPIESSSPEIQMFESPDCPSVMVVHRSDDARMSSPNKLTLDHCNLKECCILEVRNSFCYLTHLQINLKWIHVQKIHWWRSTNNNEPKCWMWVPFCQQQFYQITAYNALNYLAVDRTMSRYKILVQWSLGWTICMWEKVTE